MSRQCLLMTTRKHVSDKVLKTMALRRLRPGRKMATGELIDSIMKKLGIHDKTRKETHRKRLIGILNQVPGIRKLRKKMGKGPHAESRDAWLRPKQLKKAKFRRGKLIVGGEKTPKHAALEESGFLQPSEKRELRAQHSKLLLSDHRAWGLRYLVERFIPLHEKPPHHGEFAEQHIRSGHPSLYRKIVKARKIEGEFTPLKEDWIEKFDGAREILSSCASYKKIEDLFYEDWGSVEKSRYLRISVLGPFVKSKLKTHKNPKERKKISNFTEEYCKTYEKLLDLGNKRRKLNPLIERGLWLIKEQVKHGRPINGKCKLCP